MDSLVLSVLCHIISHIILVMIVSGMIVIIISLILPTTFSFHIPLGFDLGSADTIYTVSRDLWDLSNWALHDPALELVEDEGINDGAKDGWAWMSSVNINEWIPVFSSDATEDVFLSKKVGESEATWSDYLLSEDWFERYNAAIGVLSENHEPVCQEKRFTCPDSR